jgi:micrococcal nuclease
MPVRLALLLAALASCGGGGSECGTTSELVTRVVDGDTIELDTGVKIRYLMVNAPETTQGHNDCYGQNAVTFNTDLVLNKQVELSYDEECEDRFDRTLAYVSVGGVEVNTLMIERGYACLLHIPPNGDDRVDEFKALETAAKTAKRGLWGACDPIPCN